MDEGGKIVGALKGHYIARGAILSRPIVRSTRQLSFSSPSFFFRKTYIPERFLIRPKGTSRSASYAAQRVYFRLGVIHGPIISERASIRSAGARAGREKKGFNR